MHAFDPSSPLFSASQQLDAAPYSPKGYDASDFRRRVALRGSSGLDAEHGDQTLNPSLNGLIDRASARAAAVLIAVVDRGEAASVLLTKRTAHLRQHSGQIAFPGGGIEPGDASPEAAALREAQEETGLDPAFVETLGRLPRYFTGSGFQITPVLAVARPGFTLTRNEDEVDDIFEVPLGFLMTVANHRKESRVWNGQERFFYEMPYGPHRIWGVTAGIIRLLYERLYT
ncbi:CoA pyrophosphatase [Consotaella salsifontis]|uniref:8-oxo-dGTP pyrophosphatase MutT, NUDIX family n=1 Tax=Consotaella salsifontis TaxID=1365950 RepID=A0A1T4NWP3_9HYPH|nr:CoA pyrophosphatase [Consotaella salsifontis]SJZ83462.1 8-oxo-dGTP pyrophosphatase MutT, NUDIX family [Consotaella salsifontis]